MSVWRLSPRSHKGVDPLCHVASLWPPVRCRPAATADAMEVDDELEPTDPPTPQPSHQSQVEQLERAGWAELLLFERISPAIRDRVADRIYARESTSPPLSLCLGSGVGLHAGRDDVVWECSGSIADGPLCCVCGVAGGNIESPDFLWPTMDGKELTEADLIWTYNVIVVYIY